RVAVVDERAKVRAPAARDPPFLDRLAVIVARAVPRESQRVRPEQPLVPRAHHCIRTDVTHIERVSANRLRAVDHECGTHFSRTFAHTYEVEARSVRTVHLRHGDERGTLVDGLEQRRVP